MRVKLKGIHRVKINGKFYFYAWRGGPRLRGNPGTPEFIASYNEAVAERSAPDPARFRSVIARYKASADYKRLSESTKKNWSPWLDRISDHFGTLRIAQFDRPEKIRKIIRKWRSKWADTPRTADYGMQVLSRVLGYAVDPLGVIASNPCEGIKQLYKADRSDVIWTDADLEKIKKGKANGKKACPDEITHAIELAAHTGLRLGDLLRLSWSHVEDDAIVLATGKSRGRREAIIPLYGGLRAVLERIPKRSTTILTNSKHRPWTANGFGTAMNRAKKDAKISELNFNDLRGTAATKFYVAGFEMRVIAEMLAWEEDHVAKIIRRYVGRNAATKAMIAKLNEAERRT